MCLPFDSHLQAILACVSGYSMSSSGVCVGVAAGPSSEKRKCTVGVSVGRADSLFTFSACCV